MESNKGKPIKKIGSHCPLILLFLFGLWIHSCSAPKTAPYAEPINLPSEELENGRILFSQHCITCHPGGKSGLGPSIINKPLPKFLIRFQIRNGIGVMPAFGEEVLTDQQVERIAEYVVFLRKKD